MQEHGADQRRDHGVEREEHGHHVLADETNRGQVGREGDAHSEHRRRGHGQNITCCEPRARLERCGRARQGGDRDREGEAVEPPPGAPDPSRQQGVGREHHSAEPGPQQPDRVPVPAGAHDQCDTDESEQREHDVRAPADAGDGHSERAEEVDGDRDAEREVGQRLVQEQVHSGHRDAEARDGEPFRPRPTTKPGPDDGEQDGCGEREAKSAHAAGTQSIEQAVDADGAELERERGGDDEADRGEAAAADGADHESSRTTTAEA